MYISCGIFVCIEFPYPSDSDGKRKIRLRFFFRCHLRLNFGQIISRFILMDKSFLDLSWPSDGRPVTTILFSGPWRQKQNFSSESPVRFLYICSIYVATTHLYKIHKKIEQIHKNRTGLSLLNSALDVTDHKI